MTALWWTLSVALVAGFGVLSWSWLQPPASFDPGRAAVGHRRAVRRDLAGRYAWYPGLLALLRVLAHLLDRPGFDGARAAIDVRLVRSGERTGLGPEEFLALCLASALSLGAVLCGAVGVSGTGWAGAAALVGLAVGYALPLLFLEEMVGRRLTSIHKELPYLLDTLCVSLSAGQTFNQALRRLLGRRSERMTPLLEEMKIVLLQIQLGTAREDAFDRLKERVASNYVADVANAVRQSAELGAPLQQVFQIQSEAIRVKRTHRAERLAGEAPVKLLLPLSFIFFAILIVMLGPAVIPVLRGGLFP